MSCCVSSHHRTHCADKSKSFRKNNEQFRRIVVFSARWLWFYAFLGYEIFKLMTLLVRQLQIMTRGTQTTAKRTLMSIWCIRPPFTLRLFRRNTKKSSNDWLFMPDYFISTRVSSDESWTASLFLDNKCFKSHLIPSNFKDLLINSHTEWIPLEFFSINAV